MEFLFTSAIMTDMPSSTIVRAAFFTVGALVGGGVATVLATEKKRQLPPPPTAVIQVGPTGAPTLGLSPVLKYGDPGKFGYGFVGLWC
jgi:endonuclease G